MPPKKKNSPNGFMIFTFEWKAKYGKHLGLREATAEAGKLWADMSALQRGPYNEKAKQEKHGARDRGEKLTCTGLPVSQVEKEKQEGENRERAMKRQIETVIRNSVKNDELENQFFYFIMVNYFTKTLQGGVYVPAEISVAAYSLKDGVARKYHSFIDPGVIIYGHQYEAQHHSETTHKLPLPPKAMGEKNLGRIYNDVLNFIRDKETDEYPPVYTQRDDIPIVKSVFDFLKTDVGANNVDLKVYSIQYLFYIMKEATCEMGQVDKPKSFYITDAFFERDFFEYQTGIACQYHEDVDKTKYCTQSCVTRWGFMFSDYMCRDIAIELKPGRHLPASTNLEAVINPAPNSTFSDDATYISMASGSSVYTKALSEREIYHDDQKSVLSTIDFPTLGGARKKAVTNKPSVQHSQSLKYSNVTIDGSRFDSEYLPSDNPWASRSLQKRRVPDPSHFSIDFTHDNLEDDNISLPSCGRGTPLGRSFNAVDSPSWSGRGRRF